MTKLTDKKRKYICEELEPRILLSAGIEGLIYESGWEPDVTLEAGTDAAQIIALFNNSQTSSSTEPTSEVVFIDSSLPDYQSLIADLTENNDTNRQFEIILLDEQDGISQITAYLQSQDDIDAIHFITHGEDGQIQLGNNQLDLQNIESYSPELLLWKDALDENADILFYGCDIASTDDGLSLIKKISDLTDADVAASDDITGNEQLGGDWELEKNIGSIETSIAVSAELQDSWKIILPTVTFQEGVNGYFGTVDTQIDELTPTIPYSDDNDISADGGMNEKQGLIRFDNIFSDNGGPIPTGSTITSATLTFNVTDPSLSSASIELYTINNTVVWNDASTWASLTDGITIGTETASTADSVLTDPDLPNAQTFLGLGTTLQSWSDGGTNNGWVITNDKTNNWDFSQSDNDAPFTSNPILSVTYTANTAPVLDFIADPSVLENTTAVTTVSSSDIDAGDILVYSLAGADAGLFSIDGAGAITFDLPPDFEDPAGNTYNLQVIVTDQSGTGLSDSQNITVTVTNDNEAPVLDFIADPSVLENSTGVIATAIATDADVGDTITYSLAGVDAGLFSIDSVTGAITFTAPDFEGPLDNGGNNIYDIQVIATDTLGLTATQNIAVSVIDVNEAPTSTDQQFSVSGNSVNGSLVGIVTASDLDAGDTLSYSITDGTGVGSFAIDSSTGQLTIVNSNSLYSEVAQVYTLSVLVTDSAGATSVSNITISVSPSSNSNPVIVSPPPSEQTNPSPERNDFIAEPTLQLAGYIFNSHLITHLDPTSDSSENNGTKEANENTGSRDVKADWLTPENNEVGTDYISYRTGGAFYNALDKMHQDIDESEETGRNNVFTAGVRGTGIALTAGFASWVLRGSSLLASFLSTIPVWRGLDPLPILAAARKKQKKDINIASSKKSKPDADDIDDMFDENGNRINRNTVQDV